MVWEGTSRIEHYIHLHSSSDLRPRQWSRNLRWLMQGFSLWSRTPVIHSFEVRDLQCALDKLQVVIEAIEEGEIILQPKQIVGHAQQGHRGFGWYQTQWWFRCDERQITQEICDIQEKVRMTRLVGLLLHTECIHCLGGVGPTGYFMSKPEVAIALKNQHALEINVWFPSNPSQSIEVEGSGFSSVHPVWKVWYPGSHSVQLYHFAV